MGADLKATGIAIFLVLVLLPSGPARPQENAPKVIAAAWLEGEDGARVAVTALFLPSSSSPVTVFAGLSSGAEVDEPGGYGRVEPDTWRELKVGPKEVLLARRAVPDAATPTVLIRRSPAREAVDVHELIDEGGDPDPGAILFARLWTGRAARLDRHLAEIGDRVELTLKAPGGRNFFRDETLEICRVARRLRVDSGEPDGPEGHVAVTWVRPGEREDDPAAVLLEGEAGEKRIRAHFTNPDCAWANRHVGWMADLYIIEYLRPTELRFTVDTTPAKAPGLVSDLWRGYGAATFESIWPNGFGGSSSNLTLPPLMLVPKGTAVRQVEVE